MFKIGDKVKLISNQDTDDIAVGSIRVVTDIDNGMYDVKIVDRLTGEWYWVQSSSLELHEDTNVKPITSLTVWELEEILRLRKDIEDWEIRIKNMQQGISDAQNRLKALYYEEEI